MKYTSFSFLYPPRPENEIAPSQLNHWAKTFGFTVAQFKMNGTGNVITKTSGGELITRTRRNEEHKAWQPDNHTQKAFQHLPGWCVLVAELMNNKVPGLRHINYINDILVCDGDWLDDMTFVERQKLLRKLFPKTVPSISKGYRVIDEYTWLAENFSYPKIDFNKLFMSLSRPEEEGLVLKKSDAKLLQFCANAKANSSWQVKARRPTRALHF